MVWFLLPFIPVVAGAIIADQDRQASERRYRERMAREAREAQEELEREQRRLAEEQAEMARRRLENERRQRERERQLREEYERQEREHRERLRREEEQRARERAEREQRQREEEERQQREYEALLRRIEEERRQREEAQRRESERLEAEQEEQRKAQEERERRAREQLETERRQREQAERRERERQAKLAEELRRKEEAARAEQRARAEEFARQQEELRAQMEREAEAEQARVQQEHEEELRKQEEEKARKEAELKKKQQEHQEIEDKMKERIKEAEALYEENARLIAKGICPNLFPTEKEWEKAKARLVSGGNFHCAVAGMSGVGKSSLVNALRGIANKDPTAANIGVVETTTEITAYPDTTPSRRHWVWYDVPGAGTLTIPGPQYFNSHGLFIFDLIIVVIDNRFTSQDIAILHQCRHFKIPSFIVRSKANQQLMNIMHQQLGYLEDDDEDDSTGGDNSDGGRTQDNFTEMIIKAKEILICNTSENVKTNLQEVEFDSSQRVYVVSAQNVRLVVTGTVAQRPKSTAFMVDEEEMIKDLYKTIEDRACA